MAFVVIADASKPSGKRLKKVSPEDGALIWQILKGEKEPPSPKWAEKIENVLDVYLNIKTAPASYIEARSGIHAAMAGHKERDLPWWNKD